MSGVGVEETAAVGAQLLDGLLRCDRSRLQIQELIDESYITVNDVFSNNEIELNNGELCVAFLIVNQQRSLLQSHYYIISDRPNTKAS